MVNEAEVIERFSGARWRREDGEGTEWFQFNRVSPVMKASVVVAPQAENALRQVVGQRRPR